MDRITKGCLVRVGKELGVVTHLVDEAEVPEDHIAVWFGEIENDHHKVRTVPAEYCQVVENLIFYH